MALKANALASERGCPSFSRIRAAVTQSPLLDQFLIVDGAHVVSPAPSSCSLCAPSRNTVKAW